jgi:TIR domain
MPGVFISYRREDCAAVAGRLYDRLSQRFGAANVFRDIDVIKPGASFPSVIAEQIKICGALLALIGKNWLNAKDGEGRRRLDLPDDFVALEISEALAQGKLVIPVLIDEASMPSREALPAPLISLPDRMAIPLSDSRFDYDTGRLIDSIEGAITRFRSHGVQAPMTPSELQNRRDLLNGVRSEVTDRLDQSLHHAVPIDLAQKREPKQVRRSWDIDVKVGDQPSTPLPSGTKITDVFDHAAVAGR